MCSGVNGLLSAVYPYIDFGYGTWKDSPWSDLYFFLFIINDVWVQFLKISAENIVLGSRRADLESVSQVIDEAISLPLIRRYQSTMRQSCALVKSVSSVLATQAFSQGEKSLTINRLLSLRSCIYAILLEH